MGLKDILTKPWKFGSTELAWHEPFLYPTQLRRDALWRLLICVGIGLVAAGILLGVLSLQEERREWEYALVLGSFAFFLALFHFFGRYGQVGGDIVLRRDTIRRITTSMGLPNFIVHTEERWEYNQISECVFIPAKIVGHRFIIMLVSYGDSQDMIAIPRRINPRKVVEILQAHGVRVLRGSRLPQHATQGLSSLAPMTTVAGGLIVLIAGLVLYSTQRPPEERPMTQRPPIPGPDDMRDTHFPSLPTRIDPRATDTPAGSEDRPNQELDDMRQMRNNMRQMGDGMRPMRDGMRRERSPSFPSPEGLPGPAAPRIPRSNDNTKAAPYDLTETVGTTEGFEFKDVDYRSRPVIGVRFAMISRAGKQYIRRLTPIFYRSSLTSPNKILAKEGYALGAIHVWANEFVTGVKLEFMKLKDDTSLQLSDSYQADTIGTATTSTAKIITTDGRIVVGFHGRRTSLMNAIGLAVRK